MSEESKPLEVICKKCKRTEIVYLPKEEIPVCQKCGIRMIIRELLREGKSY